MDQLELMRIHSLLSNLLDEATFAAAFSEGWEISEEQAIQLPKN